DRRRGAAAYRVRVEPGTVADSGGVLKAVQRDVQQDRADDAALGSSLFSGREPLSSLEHPCLQPPGDHVPGGEAAELLQEEVVADLVECRRQVRVEDPCPLRVALERVIERLGRVLAAASRPEPVRSGLEPGLPLRLQRILDPRLMAPVQKHGYPERALLAV